MTIKIGEKLPSATFKEKTADGPVETTTDALLAARRWFFSPYPALSLPPAR